MKINYQSNIAACLIFLSFGAATSSYAMTNDEEAYCNKSGGMVEEMPAEISTRVGLVKGLTKKFCTFEVNGGFIAIGLETFSSTSPSIAATLIKKMGEIKADSALWRGDYANPSTNVCQNLGGSTITFIANGGFSNHLGQSDICVFGDGSMVSGWSLIYMANHRAGYDAVKNQVRAEPLNVRLPN